MYDKYIEDTEKSKTGNKQNNSKWDCALVREFVEDFDVET